MMNIKSTIIFLLIASIAFSCTSNRTVRTKVMSYNVRNCKGMDNVRDINRIARAITNAAPDIVAIQELDSMTGRSGNRYVLGEIAAQTNMNAEYFPAIDFDGGKYGIGILSREKPRSTKGYSLPGREEERALLVAEYEDFIFASTHLSLTEEDRMSSLEIIRKISSESRKTFILAGDFNALPDSPFISELTKDFHILNNPAEQTFPAPQPDRTLDYIALLKRGTASHKILNTEVLNEPAASDHRPVVVILEVRSE